MTLRGIQMRIVPRACAVALAVFVTGCNSTSVSGSGHIITDTRNVSGFTRVSLAGEVELIIAETGVESLTITADDNLLPYLTSDVAGDELKLGTKEVHVRPSKPIVYRLTVKSLTDISLAGSGSLRATALEGDRLSVKLAGSTTAKLAGKVRRLEIEIAGSGGYDGEDLKTEEAAIRIAGDGSAVVAASNKLEVDGAGSASVEYIGDPTVTQHIIGSGTVHKR